MTPAAGIAPNPSSKRHEMLLLSPDDNRIKPTRGPTISPSACIEKTSPTRRPRSFRYEYSLIKTADTG
jgi:hypothetical protein